MSEYQNAGHEIGWEDQISADGEQFITLEEGDYDFTVTGFERGRFPGSSKIPACNKAVLTLSVNTAEGTANVKYDLILWSSLEWKISAFFRSIGQKKSGEALVPKWNQVIGATGRAHFKPRKYTTKDGEERTANDVASFYNADQQQAAPAQGYAAPQPAYGSQPLQPAYTPPVQQPAGAAAWQGKF